MGRILSFTPRDAAGNRPPPAPDTPAAVIIFPGIRYERQKDGSVHGGDSVGAGPVLPRPAPTH